MQKLLLGFLAILCFNHLSAQRKAEAFLRQTDEKYPQEKIHLLLNKEAYVAGETILFKAYLFAGYVQSFISANLYVELYNNKKELIAKTQLPLVNAMGEGSLALSTKNAEGVYYLRAYTKWMMNFDPAFQYLAEVPVYNPSSSLALTKAPINWTASVFPESGIILAGEENKISVRLKTTGSFPGKWNGFVTEETDSLKKLVSFHSHNSQFASFMFTPRAGKKYLLTLSDEQNNTRTLSMEPAASGLLLRAAQDKNRIRVQMIFKGMKEGGKGYKLLAQMQGQLVYSAIINKPDTAIQIFLPADKMMSGILHLTLFDKDEKAVAERLVFVKVDNAPGDLLSPVEINKKSKGENIWMIAADSALSQTLAVAVDDTAGILPRKRNIYSDLWLGDFTSRIDNPGWYFQADSLRPDALDALLISEKWTRFHWDDMISGTYPQIRHQPEGFLSYTAIATIKDKPVAEETLNLLFRFKDSITQLAQVKTDRQGKFELRDVAFYDTVQVYALPGSSKKGLKDLKLSIEMQNQHFGFSSAFPASELTLVERNKSNDPVFVKNMMKTFESEEKQNRKYHELEEVRVEARAKSRKQKLDEQLSSALFQTGNQVVFDFVNEEQGIQSYTNIFDWLEGRVAGLNFTVADENYRPPVTATSLVPRIVSPGQKIPMIRGEEAAVYLDEMPTDLDALNTLPVSDIAMVKVIRGYFVGGSGGGGGGGTIVIYTKRGQFADKSSRNVQPLAMIAGYPVMEPFKDFDPGNVVNAEIEQDARPQLFWKTSWMPQAEGKSSFRFFNNGILKSYRIIVTAFTKNAEPLYIEKIVSVSE
jgi:hypothetical protein